MKRRAPSHGPLKLRLDALCAPKPPASQPPKSSAKHPQQRATPPPPPLPPRRTQHQSTPDYKPRARPRVFFFPGDLAREKQTDSKIPGDRREREIASRPFISLPSRSFLLPSFFRPARGSGRFSLHAAAPGAPVCVDSVCLASREESELRASGLTYYIISQPGISKTNKAALQRKRARSLLT